MMLLVDYENVQKLDLAAIPPHANVRIFVGASQAKVPMALVEQAQALGTRLAWVRIEGQGPNALDFHIGYYLGEFLAASPRTEHVILSRDRGFDPLVRHLVGRGFHVRRIAGQGEIGGVPKAAAAGHGRDSGTVPARAQPPGASRGAAATGTAERVMVVRNLGKIDKNRRPRRRRTLESQIAAYFQKKLSAAAVTAVVEELTRGGLIVIDDAGRVTYHF